ncbi:MAG: hypothetical protein JOY71_01525 [Acetobacteraceae bacterium]|nr:hypothetical protein [Acetobacteraceae bacterium]
MADEKPPGKYNALSNPAPPESVGGVFRGALKFFSALVNTVTLGVAGDGPVWGNGLIGGDMSRPLGDRSSAADFKDNLQKAGEAGSIIVNTVTLGVAGDGPVWGNGLIGGDMSRPLGDRSAFADSKTEGSGGGDAIRQKPAKPSTPAPGG